VNSAQDLVIPKSREASARFPQCASRDEESAPPQHRVSPRTTSINSLRPGCPTHRGVRPGVSSTRAPRFRRCCGIWEGSDPGFGLLGWLGLTRAATNTVRCGKRVLNIFEPDARPTPAKRGGRRMAPFNQRHFQMPSPRPHPPPRRISTGRRIYINKELPKTVAVSIRVISCCARVGEIACGEATARTATLLRSLNRSAQEAEEYVENCIPAPADKHHC
jgi:hypothetical protein